jgi:O-acetyl-ADP-ribose deacetylase (regulator of RNase III)
MEIEELKIGRRCIRLELGDITRVRTDAIVNAANVDLRGGGGVDGAIHKAAGPSLLNECSRFKSCPTGTAVITKAGNLPVKYVIHTVGPVWYGGTTGEEIKLEAAYYSCMELAKKHKLMTLAFPSVSTGAFKYPVEMAAKVALTTVKDCLSEVTSLEEVSFILYDESTFLSYQKVLDAISS